MVATAVFAVVASTLSGGAATAAVTYTVSGTVYDGSGEVPVAGATPTLYSITDDGDQGPAVGTAVKSAVNGTYKITKVPEGDYSLKFVSGAITQWWENAPTFDEADLVEVYSDTDTTGYDVSIGAVEEILPGSLEGTVTTDGDTPLPGATVEAFDDTDTTIGTQLTDEDGYFSYDELEAGDYKVKYTAATYATQWFDGKTTIDNADPVTVEDNGIGDASVIMGAAPVPTFGSISGTVRAAGGDHAAIAGAAVEIFNEDGDSLGATTTTSTGVYGFADLPAKQTYSIDVAAEGYVSATIEVDVTANTTASGDVDLVEGPSDGFSLTGTVTGVHSGDTVATPIEGVEVTVESAGPDASATTGADGTYEVTGIGGADARIRFDGTAGFSSEWFDNAQSRDAATVVDVTDGAVADAELDLGGSLAGTVSGKFDSDLELLEGITVEAYPAVGSFTPVTTETDEDGAYLFEGLAAGDYKIHAATEGTEWLARWYAAKTRLGSATPVTVSLDEPALGVDLVVPAAASIDGTVTGDDAAPVEGATASVYTLAGAFVTSETTDEDGDYSVLGLDTGVYTVEFNSENAEGGAYATAWFGKGALSQASAAAIAVKAGEDATDTNIRLKRSGSVNGVVRFSASAPAAGVDVQLFSTTGELISTTGTGDDGSYTFDGVAAGTYKLRFVSDATLITAEYWKNQTTRAKAASVAVSAGATTTVGTATVAAKAASVKGTASVTGTVTNGAGEPVAGIFVAVHRQGDTANVATTYSNSLGVYTIGGLAAGTYSVGYLPYNFDADHPQQSQYAAVWWKNKLTAGEATYFVLKAGKRATGKSMQLPLQGSISGTVTAADAASSGAVRVYTAAGNLVEGALGASYADGTYHVEGLAPGTYKLQFVPYISATTPNAPTWLGDAASFADATPVVLESAGAVVDQNVSLITDVSRITGTVLAAADALPVEDVAVDVLQLAPDGSYEYIAGGVTNGVGAFSVLGLGTGSFKLLFNGGMPENGFAKQYYLGKTTLATATAVKLTEAGSTLEVDAVSLAASAKVISLTVPKVSGTAKVGKTLKASVAAVSPTSAKFTYQWLRNGSKIKKATKSSYKLTKSDKSKEITVKVTASKSGYTSTSKISLPKNTLG